MEALNIFLGLIGKTEGRDKFLRLIQYGCLHSVAQPKKGAAFNVYNQMRITRKLLRFLRSIDYSNKIKQQIPELKKSLKNWGKFLKHLTSVLQNLCTVIFFLSDHRVCLSQLGIISKQQRIVNYPRSMKFYFFQNLMGVIHNLICMTIAIQTSNDKDQKYVNKKNNQTVQAIKAYSFDLIRCLLDCLVALFYWKGANLPPKKVGIIGVISSIMAIIQFVEKM